MDTSLELSDEERSAIALYKDYQQKHLPDTETLAGLWAPNFDRSLYSNLDYLGAIRAYLNDLEPYVKVLERAAYLRQQHFDNFINNNKNRRIEEEGHRRWREGMNMIAADARQKYDHWKTIHDLYLEKAIDEYDNNNFDINRDKSNEELLYRNLGARNVDHNNNRNNNSDNNNSDNRKIVQRPPLSKQEKERRKKLTKAYAKKRRQEEESIINKAAKDYTEEYDQIDNLRFKYDSNYIKPTNASYLVDIYLSLKIDDPLASNYLLSKEFNENDPTFIHRHIVGSSADIHKLLSLLFDAIAILLKHRSYILTKNDREIVIYLKNLNTPENEIEMRFERLINILSNIGQNKNLTDFILPELIKMLTNIRNITLLEAITLDINNAINFIEMRHLCYGCIGNLPCEVFIKNMNITVEDLRAEDKINQNALKNNKSHIDNTHRNRQEFNELILEDNTKYEIIKIYLMELYPEAIWVVSTSTIHALSRPENALFARQLLLHNSTMTRKPSYDTYSCLKVYLEYVPVPSDSVVNSWNRNYKAMLLNIKGL